MSTGQERFKHSTHSATPLMYAEAPSQLQTSHTHERRRQTRYASNIVARCHVKTLVGGVSPVGLGPQDGEVREFSDSGIFFAPTRSKPPHGGWSLLVGATVTIELRPPTAAQKAQPVLTGRITHASAAGYGVDLDKMHPEALALFREVSEQVALQHHSRATTSVVQRQATALLEECRRRFRHSLVESIAVFFDEVSAQTKTSFGWSSAGMCAPLAQAAGLLAPKQQELTQRWREDFDIGLQRIGHANPPASTPKAAKSKLSLLNDRELDLEITLATAIERIEEPVVAQLTELERRLSLLLDTRIDRRNNPFAPASICRAFQVACRGIEAPATAWPPLYTVLHQVFAQRVESMYGEVLALLSPLRFETLPRVARTSPSALRRGTTTSHDAPSVAGSASRSDAAARAALDVVPKIGGILGVVARLVAAERYAANPYAFSAQSNNPPAQDNLPIATVKQAYRAVDVAVESLGNLSANATTAPLGQWLNTQLARGVGGAPVRLPEAARQRVDAAQQLWHQVTSTHAPNSAVKALLQRLDRLFVKLALTDRTFPSAANHPARQVIDLIDQYALATDGHEHFLDAKLLERVSALIGQLGDNAIQDRRVFEDVSYALERELAPLRQMRRTRVERAQEAFEARDRARLARAQVDIAVAQRFAGRSVPRPLLRLLDVGLRHFLVLSALREGTFGVDWSNWLSFIDQVLIWQESPETRLEMTAPLAAAAMEMERRLQSIPADTSEYEPVLHEILQAISPDASRAGGESFAVVRYPDAPKGGSATHAGTMPASIADLRVGSWWTLNSDVGQSVMQLICFRRATGDCAFANRSGTRTQEMLIADFAKKFEAGEIVTCLDPNLPVVERCESVLLDAAQQRLVVATTTDESSGLINRKGFLQRLATMMVPPMSSAPHAVCVIEFDQYRIIGNACGFEAVDALNRDLIAKMLGLLAERDVLAAVGEGTFALLLPYVDAQACREKVDLFIEALRDHAFEHDEQSYRIGVHIGVTDYVPTECTPADALRRADSACMTARAEGRNQIEVYEGNSKELARHESMMNWAGKVDSMLSGSGLYLRAQKVAPIGYASHRLPYYEILLGVEDAPESDGGPSGFITAIERLGRSAEIDLWVIKKTLAWLHQHRTAASTIGGVAINLSAHSLSNGEVKSFLQQALPRLSVPPEKIIFEITETAAIRSYEAAQAFIRDLRRFGCRFALDDFGTGFTSYAHLKLLDCDILKIDGSFVVDIVNNPQDFAMVKSMNEIAHAIGMKTVAEWAETPEVVAKLIEIGIDYAQGFAVHRPERIAMLSASLADAA